jgi:hypothetical protein
MRNTIVFILLVALQMPVSAQSDKPTSAFRIARLKYAGGGDWYNDPSAEVNLLRYVKQYAGVDTDPVYTAVEVGSEQMFSYPMVFMTGHGNIALQEKDVRALRTYLEQGGFLYADDDYGMDKAFRREIKKVFPESELVELPFTHGIYRTPFPFPAGPPKTHAHDDKPPRGYGLFHNNRLVVFYTVESNPSDGWADPEVHGDPPDKRQEALRFGTNIVVWALTR